MMILLTPEATASSITYWMIGLSTSGSISFGCALVAGRKRVPSPAAGRTALRTFCGLTKEWSGEVGLDVADKALVIVSIVTHMKKIVTILRCSSERVNDFEQSRCLLD